MVRNTNPRRNTAPDYAPWPAVGYVSRLQMRAALGGCSDATLFNYVERGLLPKPLPYGPNRTGWRVDDARQALEALPSKVKQRTRIVPDRRKAGASSNAGQVTPA